MAWSKLAFLRAASDAILPALTEAVPAWVQSRKRLVIHNGTEWVDIAYRTDRPVGELLMSEFEETTSETFPAVARNVVQTLSSANWPLLVPKLRAAKTSIAGVTDYTVTVSGSTVTFTSTGDKLLSLIQANAIAAKFLIDGEPTNFANGTDYTTSDYQRCINIAGTDYAITGANVAGRTLTVSGTPASGSQTAIVYTYRIAGSTTTARLPKISGFVGVVAGDASGEVVGGWLKMDRGQGHWHESWHRAFNVQSGSSATINATGSTATAQDTADRVRASLSDGTDGTPRTGKTFDPRTYGQYAYTWGGKYVA